MPWLSRSAWTTLASMFDPVLKMTMSSDINSQHDHRHIVVLIGGSCERPEVGKDKRTELLERQMRILLEHLGKPRLSITIESDVHRFADAIGEEDEQIILSERNDAFLQQRRKQLAVVDGEPDHQAIRRNHLRLAHA